MSTMQKKSAVSGTLRTMDGSAFASDSSLALVDGIQTWLTASNECQHEMMNFLYRRLEKDSDTMREILASKNFADASEIHARWIEETFRDYSSQMTKLMTIYTRIGASGVPARNL